MRRTRLSPDLTLAIAGGKSRNHGCTQALSPDDPMDQSLKGPPGAFIPYQGLKGTQIGVSLRPVRLAQLHIASFVPQFVGALYPYLAFGGTAGLGFYLHFPGVKHLCPDLSRFSLDQTGRSWYNIRTKKDYDGLRLMSA